MAGRGTDIRLGQGAAALGGLYVIGTQKHESRRIDNQLRGRAGRQGDPGGSRFYVSLEDDLLVKYGDLNPELGSDPDTVQRLVEGHHLDARLFLQKYEVPIEGQRYRIHKHRQAVLAGHNALRIRPRETGHTARHRRFVGRLSGARRRIPVEHPVARLRSGGRALADFGSPRSAVRIRSKDSPMVPGDGGGSARRDRQTSGRSRGRHCGPRRAWRCLDVLDDGSTLRVVPPKTSSRRRATIQKDEAKITLAHCVCPEIPVKPIETVKLTRFERSFLRYDAAARPNLCQ